MNTSKILIVGICLFGLSFSTACEQKTGKTREETSATPPKDKDVKKKKAPKKETPEKEAPKTDTAKKPTPPTPSKKPDVQDGPPRDWPEKLATKIKPDGADTATKPPKAEDLKRYTSDLGDKGKLMARIKTSMGEFNCELYEKKTPITVANFVGLGRGLKAWQHPETKTLMVGQPLYHNVRFHRVMPKFMIQGGAPLGNGRNSPGYNFQDEFDPGLKHDRPGILSMANRGPGTNGSQFFITEVPTPFLDNKHTVFGQCDNVKLVKKITNVPKKGSTPDKPVLLEHIQFSRR